MAKLGEPYKMKQVYSKATFAKMEELETLDAEKELMKLVSKELDQANMNVLKQRFETESRRFRKHELNEVKVTADMILEQYEKEQDDFKAAGLLMKYKELKEKENERRD